MDIKPENILIGPEGQIMVADFGSSVTHHDLWNGNRKEDNIMAGITPLYKAPEHSGKDRQLNQKYDTWSIGVMMHDIMGEDFSILKGVDHRFDIDKELAAFGADKNNRVRQTSDNQKNLTGFDQIVNALNHPDPAQRPTLDAAFSHSYFQDPELNKPELQQLWKALVNDHQAEVTRLKDLI